MRTGHDGLWYRSYALIYNGPAAANQMYKGTDPQARLLAAETSWHGTLEASFRHKLHRLEAPSLSLGNECTIMSSAPSMNSRSCWLTSSRSSPWDAALAARLASTLALRSCCFSPGRSFPPLAPRTALFDLRPLPDARPLPASSQRCS